MTRFYKWRSVGIRARRLAVDTLLSVAAFFTVTIFPLLQVEGPEHLDMGRLLVGHIAIFAIVAAAALALTGAHRRIWRYVSFRDLLSLMGASAITVVVFFVAEVFITRPSGPMPPNLVIWTLILMWTASVGFLAVPRLVTRVVSEILPRNVRGRGDQGWIVQKILLCGDPMRMEAFIRESLRNPESRYLVVGLLSEESALYGSQLYGAPVIGGLANLKEGLDRLHDHGIHPDVLVLAKDDPSAGEFATYLDAAAAANIKLARLHPAELADKESPVVPVKLSDLLRRPEVNMNMGVVANLIAGKCAVVTGGGGSIGSEICRQVAKFKPARLVVLDNCEFNLYSIDKELEEKFPDISRTTALVDVRDGNLITKWIQSVRPDVVFHAAALKHVPLIEDHAIEGIKTNVFGTVNIAEACRDCGVSVMVTISTDKAVNPTNVMGATKRLAEAFCQGLDQSPKAETSTRYVTVRFGNVLGSAGSVVPLFQRQIEAGGPVTVTHPDIKRYFMTIPEAVTLVLQAGALGMDAMEDRGKIYVLDMGEPVRIVDLARRMITLAGSRPDIDIGIKYVGLRPGEKLYEEIAHTDEPFEKTNSKLILALQPRSTDLRILRQQIQELKATCGKNDVARAIHLLKVSVPCFTPSAELLNYVPAAGVEETTP